MNLALFDFDGTITTRETFPDFMRLAVPPRRLALGRVLFAPLVIGYRLGLVSGSRIRAAMVDFGFRGVPLRDVEIAGETIARDVLPALLRMEAMQRIEWHKAREDVVVVVSGGFDLYLSHWCRQQGLEVICSTLESRAGILTGRYLGEQCVGLEKCRRIRDRFQVEGFATIYAYGDTTEDLAMLEMAHEKRYRWQPAD